MRHCRERAAAQGCVSQVSPDEQSQGDIYDMYVSQRRDFIIGTGSHSYES